MKSSAVLTVAVFLSVLPLFSSCEQQEAPALDSGHVEATQAYVQNFGDPPQGKKGRAFARVAYLPIKNNPGKLRAFPVYLFSEGDHLPNILERLVSKELFLPPDSAMFKPFPDDLHIDADPPSDGLRRIRLTTQQSWSSSQRAAAGLALAETALQFPDVDRVKIYINGSLLASMPEGGFVHNAQRLAELGPPALVLIAAAWEDGEDNPSELMVEFDRPIKVNSFELHGPTGERVEGDYYTSIFQMAVIVHPEKPGLFQEGVEMHAEWDVVDTLGRVGRGSKTLRLHRYDH